MDLASRYLLLSSRQKLLASITVLEHHGDELQYNSVVMGFGSGACRMKRVCSNGWTRSWRWLSVSMKFAQHMKNTWKSKREQSYTCFHWCLCRDVTAADDIAAMRRTN